jgi:hypothetical protein
MTTLAAFLKVSLLELLMVHRLPLLLLVPLSINFVGGNQGHAWLMNWKK